MGNGMHDGGELGGESERIKDRQKMAARQKAQAKKDKEAAANKKARRGSLTDNLQRWKHKTKSLSFSSRFADRPTMLLSMQAQFFKGDNASASGTLRVACCYVAC